MNLTVDRLKELFVKLGGAESVVSGCSTIVEVLNAISAKYDGKNDAILNPDAISNITEIADKIGGGGIPSNALVIEGATDIKLSLFNDDLGITSVVVPGTVETVRGFANCKNLKSVNIKSGVQSIESEAFAGCTSLIDLALEDGLVEIAEAAFSFCISLRNLSTDAKFIGSHAFEGCEGLKKIELREGVETLHGSPFIGVSLDSPLILPSSMKLIEELAFEEMFGDIYCRFSADSPAAANAPWGATGNVVFDYTGD